LLLEKSVVDVGTMFAPFCQVDTAATAVLGASNVNAMVLISNAELTLDTIVVRYSMEVMLHACA
jgi:hypothetical protein